MFLKIKKNRKAYKYFYSVFIDWERVYDRFLKCSCGGFRKEMSCSKVY